MLTVITDNYTYVNKNQYLKPSFCKLKPSKNLSKNTKISQEPSKPSYTIKALSTKPSKTLKNTQYADGP